MPSKQKFKTIFKGQLAFEVPTGKDKTTIRVLLDDSTRIATLYYRTGHNNWCCICTYSLPKGLLRTIVDFMDTLEVPKEGD